MIDYWLLMMFVNQTQVLADLPFAVTSHISSVWKTSIIISILKCVTPDACSGKNEIKLIDFMLTLPDIPDGMVEFI